MKKKIIIVAVALAILLGVFSLYNIYQNNLGNDNSKNIKITIKADDDIVLDDTFKTNAATLESLLIELNENGTIKLEYEDSQYGMYIKGLGKNEIFKESINDGLFWTFESPNNETCLANDFCPAASSLEINDGDNFVFRLQKYE